ncbi:MAG: amidohydrolase family protein [Chlorobi bacterium]|nr:amidohydrolase family protein [Chlorobiota bacterium]
MDLLLKNATYIDWRTLEFRETHILVTGGTNGAIRFTDKFPEEKDYETLDCTGKYVTKSFAVGHHHAYSALARGMPAPEKLPQNFLEILQYIWWSLDKALDRESIKASALVTAMACAKAGATFVIDHHASPNSIEGSLNIIAEAFEEVGISHLLCYEISDRDGIEKAEAGLSETGNYLQKKQGLVGLHASFTVGNETLKKAAEMMEKMQSGIHIHVAEDLLDEEDSRKKYGKRVIERLNDYGILNSQKTILAHCLHLDEKERELVRISKAWVVENMESNLNNNVGYFNGNGLGERIMLGTDGMHSDMLRSAQQAYFAGQRFDNIDFRAAYARLRNVHKYLSHNGFSGDGENNLVVLDYPTPTPFNKENFLSHFIFGLSSCHVRDVISSGKLIVRDKKLLTVNEEEINGFSKEQALHLWSKMISGK